MTQQAYLEELRKRVGVVPGQFNELLENTIEIAKQAYDAGFQEGTDVANEIYSKVSNLLNK